MFVQGQSTSPEGSKPDRSHGARKGTNHLLRLQVLGMLMIVAVACQSPTPAAVTQQWVPPYAQWYLTAGQVQVQWSDDSDWIVLESETLITIEETGQIIADDAMGARFSVGSGSVLELSPGTTLELHNPRSLPRIQVIIQNGYLLFSAQEPSYELFVPGCSVSLLSIPLQIEIEVNDETARLGVREGAVACAMEEEIITISVCQELHLRPGKKPELVGFCSTSAPTSPPPTPSSTPSPTPRLVDPTATLTFSPTPTSTTAPTSTLTPTPTPTSDSIGATAAPVPVLPTDTPLPTPQPPPPTKKPAPRRTNTPQPPPTQPPPTQPPPTQPPPTQPPPTQPPPTQSRPTLPPPTEPRPTTSAG